MEKDQIKENRMEEDQFEGELLDTVTMKDPATGEESEFYVLEQTCIGGVSYLLITETLEEESQAYILKEIQTEDEDVIYEVVTDTVELDALMKVFSELIEDIEFE
ncbi:MAG: DUF1292 domain-containing protein [Lachnospiraceae bacterium]|nr:DUF1292 domain-containing protein [Lachnospiraceae bacterium]